MSLLHFFGQTLRIATPYLFAAAGGALAERAGVVSLTLEGFMLGGAFGAAIGAWLGGGAWFGILGGLAVGLLLGGLHALGSIRFGADQIVSGVAINLLVVGATRFALQLAFDSSSNSPRIAGFDGFANPLIWAALLLTPLLAVLLNRTRLGLRIRAVGEHPQAAATLGVPVARVQAVAVVISGGLAALGGAYLTLDQHQFTDSMTAGRGFIALAAVIFGRWQPLRAAVACLLFAAAETLQIQLQATQWIAAQFVVMIPYVLTIVAVAGAVTRAKPPAALGRPLAS